MISSLSCPFLSPKCSVASIVLIALYQKILVSAIQRFCLDITDEKLSITRGHLAFSLDKVLEPVDYEMKLSSSSSSSPGWRGPAAGGVMAWVSPSWCRKTLEYFFGAACFFILGAGHRIVPIILGWSWTWDTPASASWVPTLVSCNTSKQPGDLRAKSFLFGSQSINVSCCFETVCTNYSKEMQPQGSWLTMRMKSMVRLTVAGSGQLQATRAAARFWQWI